MEPVKFVTYQGKRILVEDFTQAKAGPDFIKGLDAAKKVIASEPPRSVLAVFDATGAAFNNETLTAMKNFTKANTPYIKAAAVVGINGMLKIALTAVAAFSGREFITFQTRTEAMDWLASH